MIISKQIKGYHAHVYYTDDISRAIAGRIREYVEHKFTVVMGNSYGAGNYAMCGKAYDPRLIVAWPTAEIAVMGAKGAAEIIFKNEIKTAKNPEEKWKEKEAEYAFKFADPYRAARRGFIDEVIYPKNTRRKLIKAFQMLESKEINTPKRKHGNIPL